jgi:hypothetical protein
MCALFLLDWIYSPNLHCLVIIRGRGSRRTNQCELLGKKWCAVHIPTPLGISFHSQCTKEQMHANCMDHLGVHAPAVSSFLKFFGVKNTHLPAVKTETWIALSWEQVIRQGKVGCSTALQRSPVVALQRRRRKDGGSRVGPMHGSTGWAHVSSSLSWYGDQVWHACQPRDMPLWTRLVAVLRTKGISHSRPFLSTTHRSHGWMRRRR